MANLNIVNINNLSDNSNFGFNQNEMTLYTWTGLPSTLEVTLIRYGDKLKYKISYPDGKIFEEDIPFPDGFLIEDCIENMRELVPIISANGTLTFDKPQEITIHTWTGLPSVLEVTLIRYGDKLKYKITFQNGNTIEEELLFPPSYSIESFIENIKQLTPIVSGDDVVHFVKQVNPEKINSVKSKIDPETIIDGNHWAVTLVDEQLPTCGPQSLGSHACLYIERIENGAYYMSKAHLILSRETKVGTVRLNEIDDFQSKIVERSETWLVDRFYACNMIDQIKEEISLQKQGKQAVILDSRGRGAIWVASRSNGVPIENCFTWAADKLAYAGIYLYDQAEIKLVALPRTHISPSSLHSKEKVLVAIRGKSIEDQMDQHLNPENLEDRLKWLVRPRILDRRLDVNICVVDVTEEIHKRVNERAWKVHLFSVIEETGIPHWPVTKYAAKTEFLSELSGRIHRVEIPIKIRGSHLINIDVTDAVQSRITRMIDAGECAKTWLVKTLRIERAKEIKSLEKELEETVLWRSVCNKEIMVLEVEQMRLEKEIMFWWGFIKDTEERRKQMEKYQDRLDEDLKRGYKNIGDIEYRLEKVVDELKRKRLMLRDTSFQTAADDYIRCLHSRLFKLHLASYFGPLGKWWV